MKLFELTTEIICKRPPRWQTHLRYALHLSGCELTLPAGTWLLELAAESDNTFYRLADGTVVTFAQPLLESMAKPVDHPEALRAMASYRSLEQAALEDWGVHLEHIDSSAPFRLIKCPLCWGTEFASVDFAQVWCNTCDFHSNLRKEKLPGDQWAWNVAPNFQRTLRIGPLFQCRRRKRTAVTHRELCVQLARSQCTGPEVQAIGSSERKRPTPDRRK